MKIHGATHDAFFVTTTYGITLAIDAANGKILWRWTPPAYSHLAGSAQITTATPVADPSRKWIYTASSDGRIQKLTVASGHVVWRRSITREPSTEKIAASLNFANGHVIATTGGYIGDAPPYQGHVVVIAPGNGRLLHVWNSLCSNRHGLLDPVELPRERLGDLGTCRCGGRPRQRQAPGGHGQRAVGRPHLLGRRRARALARR